jgi:hypothetical protein
MTAFTAPSFTSEGNLEEEFDLGLGHEVLTRVRQALIDLTLESGGCDFDVVELCDRAGIGADEFESCFGTLEVAFVWVHLSYTVGLKANIARAFEAQSSWADAIRAAAYAAARWFEENPRALRFGLVYSRGAGEKAEIAREETLDWAIDLIDTGRSQLDDPDSKDRSTAIAAMGASYTSLSNGVMQHGDEIRPVDFVANWLYVAVMPYLGREAALAELDRRDSDLERYRRGEI